MSKKNIKQKKFLLWFYFGLQFILTYNQDCSAQFSTNKFLGNITFDHNNYRISIDSIKTMKKDTVHIPFPFKNTGSSSHKIIEVKSSCSCTAGQYPNDEIKVGKGGIITLTTTTAAILQKIKLHAIIKSNAANDYVVLRIIPY